MNLAVKVDEVKQEPSCHECHSETGGFVSKLNHQGHWYILIGIAIDNDGSVKFS